MCVPFECLCVCVRVFRVCQYMCSWQFRLLNYVFVLMMCVCVGLFYVVVVLFDCLCCFVCVIAVRFIFVVCVRGVCVCC